MKKTGKWVWLLVIATVFAAAVVVVLVWRSKQRALEEDDDFCYDLDEDNNCNENCAYDEEETPVQDEPCERGCDLPTEEPLPEE